MTQKKVILGNASPSLQAWIIAMFAVVLYFNTLFYDYTLDDLLMITGNEYTKQGLKWEGGIQKILFTDALSGFLGENKNLLPGGRYRPLSQLWFSLEKEMFGFNPFVGHLFNVLLYSLTCVFLFFTLRKLFKPDKNPWHLAIPFLATMIFVAHPLHTEVVANIKGRDELLSLFFNISLIYCSVEYIKTQKTKFLLFLPFLFFLGILSKENTLTFLAVIPLTLFVFTKAKAKQYVFVLLMLFIGFGGYLILRYEALGFLMSTVPNLELLNSPFMEVEKLGMSKMATLFYTYAVYLKLLFFPHPLTHDYYPYHIELITWSNSVAIFSFLIYAALFVYAIIRIWRKDIIAYGILFYLAVFSIASNLLVNIGAFMNERFVFIALLGFAII
nr:glycosyltransferase family 39 protein [Bacteroidota bacterium]